MLNGRKKPSTKTMSGAASAATIAAATTAAAIVAANATVDNPSHPARSANENRRDPQIRAFEQYLLDNLRQSDVTTDNEGVYLFNVNQVAYLVEGSRSQEEKRSTRRRLAEKLQGFSHVMVSPSIPGAGWFTSNPFLCFGGKLPRTPAVRGGQKCFCAGNCPGLPPSGVVKRGSARETTPDSVLDLTGS